MSTRYSDVKSNCYQIEVLTERLTLPLHNISAEKEKVGGFQDACGNENSLTGRSDEHVQTTKNLYIRRRILLGRDEWISTPENQIDSHNQLRFTSFYSLRPSYKRTARTRTHNCCAKQLSNNDLQAQSDAPRRVADVQPQEVFNKTFLPSSLRESTPKDEDVSNSQDCLTDPSQQIHAGNHILEGIQCSLGSCDQTQPATNCSHSQSGSSEHQRPVPESKSAEEKCESNDTSEQNAEGRLSHSDLISFNQGTCSKANTDCQFSACFPTAINQVCSSPSFSAFDQGNKLETEADLISTTAAMFTSTLVSVLAPHWSGKFRRHKQGLSEGEPDIQMSGQNTNPAGSTQNIRQKSFLLNQVQPHSERHDVFNNKTSGPPGTSRNYADWQKDISENITSNLQSKRSILKASSSSPNSQTVDMTTEFDQEPRPSHSLQLNDYRRMSQSVDQAKFHSRSRPTTSTLLLSSRRLNSQKTNTQPLQMSKQLSSSVNSLNLPSKGILKNSSPYSSGVPSNDLTKESNILSASLEQLSCAEKSTISRDTEALRKPLYSRNREFDISYKSSQATTRERLYSNDISNKPSYVTAKDMLFSNSLRFNQPETHKYFQRHQTEFLKRHDSHVENSGPVEQTSTDKENLYSSTNFNIHSPQSAANWNSPKDNGHSRFIFTQELNNRSPVSPNYQSSDSTDNNTSRHNSSSSATSTNVNLPRVSLNQLLSPRVSNSDYSIINSDKTNTGYSTTSYTSLSSPKPIQSAAVSSSVGLTVVSPTQSGQSHIQNPSSADKLSSSPISSSRVRTFADRLSISPKKDSSVDETSPTHKWQNYLNSRRQLESTQSMEVDQKGPQSPADFKLRRACTPSIYSYLRETSSPNTTETSSPFSSPSPLTPSLKQDRSKFLREDKNAGNPRFSFDFSPVGSQDGDFKHNSPTTSAPQSLPVDSGGRSMTRLSKSPYSTLISSRQRLSSTSSPSPSSPNGSYHKRSMSFDSSVIGIDSPKDENNCYPLTNRYQLIYRTIEEPVGSGSNHAGTRTALGTPAFLNRSTQSLNISSEDLLDTRLPDHRTTNLLTKTTRTKQGDGFVKITPHKGLNGMFTSQRDKGNTSPADTANSKKVSLRPSTATITETVQEEAHEVLQRSHSFYSRKGLFSLLNRKDNVPTTGSAADKEDSTSKKGEVTGFKTTKKVDQMLHRLKVTFGVKLSDDDFPTVKKKTKNQEPSDIKPSENTKKEEDKRSESQTFKSSKSTNSKMITERESDKPSGSSGSKLERQNNLLNVNDHKRLYENRKLFPRGQPSSESTKKDGERRVESPTLKSPKIPNPQITAVKKSDLSFGPISECQPIKQENLLNIEDRKQFDVNVDKQLNLLKPDTKKEVKRLLESPTLTYTVSSNPPVALMRESGNSSGPMSGFKLEKQEAVTHVNNLKTFDEWILCQKRSPDWEKPESSRKEQRQFDSPTLKSQKSPDSQIMSMRESGHSSGRMSGFKLEKQEAVTNVNDLKTLDEWILCQKRSPDMVREKPESSRKEQRQFDSPTLKSQKSPDSQIMSMRESGHSSGRMSGFKLEKQEAVTNVNDLKTLDEWILCQKRSPDMVREKPESSRKEQRQFDSPTLKSQKSPDSQIISMRESGHSSGRMSGFKLEKQEAVTNVNNLKTLDEWILCQKRSFDVVREKPEISRREEQRQFKSPTLKSQKSPDPQIISMRESGHSSGRMSGFKLEKQEAVTNVNNRKTLDIWILCQKRSPDWEKPESTRKEEERQFDSPTLKSQKSPDSQIISMRESGHSSGPMSGFKLEKQEAVTNVNNRKTLDEWILCQKRSPDWEKPESTRKEEERQFDSPTLKSQKSPDPQIISMRESGHSSSLISSPKSEKLSPNVDDIKQQIPNLAVSESLRKEEEKDLKSQSLKSIKSPNSPIALKSKFETPSAPVSGYKSESQESSPNVDNDKQLEKRKRFLGSPLSPNWPTPDLRDRSATLPLGRKSSLSPSPSPYSLDLLSEDGQNDNVFYSPKLRKKRLVETKDVPNLDTDTKLGQQNSVGPDLMYGIQRGRSVSVSSVVSGRPSGPGRISTGSKQGSISDLSSLDVTRSRQSSISSPAESPDYVAKGSNSHLASMKSKGSTGQSPADSSIVSPVNLKASSCSWDAEMDPTPPPSPTVSRRMSQISCSSSSSRNSPDSLSPRRFLPSRSYMSTLSAFDESSSDTTTDDEYYLNSDDDNDQETEL